MTMSLRDLEYVLAVEEHGSITRAAVACEVTQPTLSAQIAKLERELGVQIFERDGRGVKITDAGRTILEHARRIVGAVEDLQGAMEIHRDPLAGVLRLGLIPTLGPYLLPLLLPAIRAGLPRIALRVVEEQTGALLERVRSGQLDASLIATESDDERLVTTALFAERLWLALPAAHPLARREAIAPREIDPATLLLLAEGHCLRDQALALCREPLLGVRVPGDFRAASLETILHLVEAGHGMTLIPALSLEHARRRGAALALRPLDDPAAARVVRLVARRSSPRAALLAELGALVTSCAGGASS
jgi:LysR family hydrogen peroxide-inducible transcriptional activator